MGEPRSGGTHLAPGGAVGAAQAAAPGPAEDAAGTAGGVRGLIEALRTELAAKPGASHRSIGFRA